MTGAESSGRVSGMVSSGEGWREGAGFTSGSAVSSVSSLLSAAFFSALPEETGTSSVFFGALAERKDS